MEPDAPEVIIDDGLTTPLPDLHTLADELESLLAAPTRDDERSLVRLEDTLTAGYAGALALEAERLRLERRLGELAGEIAAGAADGGTHRELASLGERLSGADARLEELRALLAEARVRASNLRAAVTAS